MSPINGDWTSSSDWNPTGYSNAVDASAVLNAAGASYTVTLGGSDPLVTIAGLSLAANAALTIANVGGTETVGGGLTNAGFLGLDSDEYTSEGGSSLTVAGTLTNSGTLKIGHINGALTANTTLTVGALSATGTIGLYGGSSTQATLDVLSTASTTLSFNLTLQGNSLLEYASGQVGTIAGGIGLYINGATARIADTADTTHNSALTGLTENDGALTLVNGASVSVGGNLTNTGFLGLDSDDYTNEGGSSLGIAGTLANSGPLRSICMPAIQAPRH